MRELTEQELDIIVGGIRYQMMFSSFSREANTNVIEWAETNPDFLGQFQPYVAGTRYWDRHRAGEFTAHRRSVLMFRYSSCRPVMDAQSDLTEEELDVICGGLSFDIRFRLPQIEKWHDQWRLQLPNLGNQIIDLVNYRRKQDHNYKSLDYWGNQAVLMGQFIIGQPIPDDPIQFDK